MTKVSAVIGGKEYQATNGPSIATVLRIEDAFNAITEIDFEAWRAKRILLNQFNPPTLTQMRGCIALIQR
jgi:hypothetical protein